MHINPDHFLETPEGRVWSDELNRRAWAASFDALERALGAATAETQVYLMVGAQGSGKSTWARGLKAREPHAVIFDAILVKKSERAPIVAAARRHGVRATAVWMRTPLDACVARNAARPADEVADEGGLRNVFAALEPPTLDEGFHEVIEVSHEDAGPFAPPPRP